MRKLNYKGFIKPYRKVKTHIYSTNGVTMWKREIVATIVDGKKYTPTGKETERFYGDAKTKIKFASRNESGEYIEIVEFAYLGDLQPLRMVSECNERDLRKLYHEIVFGSDYYSDYKNSLEVDTHDLLAYCEGYTDEVANEYPDDWEKHLSEEDFVTYCFCVEAV